MRIAIPVADGRLCSHFGHCETFALIDVDEDSRRILKTDYLTPPPHAPGVLPQWLAEQGASVILAGGMGSRAQMLFSERGIAVVAGAQPAEPEALAQAYVDGTLVTGANACDH
jgi:ATP-binding protein involved in chromosome partitioning